MRHLWSLFAGVVAAPLAWLCLATGQFRSSRTVATWNEENFFDTAELITPAAFVAAAGILLGLLGTLRWSPAGPLVAGLLFIVPTVGMFIDPFWTLDQLEDPKRLVGQDLQPGLPVENGTLLVLGALLLMAVFSAQRWRRWPAAAAAPAVATVPEPGEATAVSAPAAMSDEEILAAAAAMEEDEKEKAGAKPAATTGEPPATPAEPATSPAPAEPAKSSPTASAQPQKQREPEPDSEQSGTRSGTSAKS